MRQHRTSLKDTTYRRAYRLYNKLYGRFNILDSRSKTPHKPNSPLLDFPIDDMNHVGSVLLEGWVSA